MKVKSVILHQLLCSSEDSHCGLKQTFGWTKYKRVFKKSERVLLPPVWQLVERKHLQTMQLCTFRSRYENLLLLTVFHKHCPSKFNIISTEMKVTWRRFNSSGKTNTRVILIVLALREKCTESPMTLEFKCMLMIELMSWFQIQNEDSWHRESVKDLRQSVRVVIKKTKTASSKPQSHWCNQTIFAHFILIIML